MSTLSKNFQHKLKRANQAHPESLDKNACVPTLEHFLKRCEKREVTLLNLCTNGCYQGMAKMKRQEVNMQERWSGFHWANAKEKGR